ncbi:Rho GTPase activation protein [Gilbertella persicaria]|uniref:Rho GTPase activation protein n=1 Tax=Gilbertella persicaria TaxID=101096 RepID=UPI00221F7776|nr:Rho GTPase activation protein [Gilbertella persicaria]KAI8067615.1 Rho GTPase activation protein [Gilbertella persicaria]
MRSHSRLSDSDSSTSIAFSDDESEGPTQPNSNSQLFAKFVRDTRSRVEQKTSEINATMQEKLPEWKQRGAMYSTKAKETSIEWSRRGKEAVDRWKKERQEVGKENAVFGMPLEIAVALTRVDTDDLIPAIVRRCIDYLNDVGIHEVGIYRIPGSTTTVNKLRAVFNDGSDIDFFQTQPDPHAVGTLLKMYLRELPEPIIPHELVDEYELQCTMDTPQAYANIRLINSRLPLHHFCLLQRLCQHLKRVVDHAYENRMSVSNLAVIFLPTLNMSRALFHGMIEHYEDIFVKKPPPLPQKPRNLSIDNTPSKRILHSKTMSDTHLMKKVPPPKPSRSPLKPDQPHLPPRPISKPRSKSVSLSDPPRGRVEAIGKQFETLMQHQK